MKKEAGIPRLGQLLRVLIKAGGYRSCLVDQGLDKNLDDVAVETKGRQSSAFEVMQGIEDACSKALAEDCGHEWAQFLRQAWFRTREAMQALVQHVDVTPLPLETERELFAQEFAVPMLSGFIHLAVSLRGGGNAELWLVSPLRMWLTLAASRSGTAEQTLLINLANEVDADQRTIERWLSGDPIGKVSWPYAPKVKAIVGKSVTESDVHLLTGWLLVACAFQSLSPSIREAVRRDLVLRKQHPWDLESAIAKINREGYRLGDSPLRSEVVPVLNEVQQAFSIRPCNEDVLRTLLGQFQALIDQAPPALWSSYQYIHDWFTARHAALLGDIETALGQYVRAVSGAWWRAGGNQHPILQEALLYAVGVGDKDSANAYWDKTFLLGLNRPPKRPLDEQETRRIAFAFERYFYPLKAKDRIPPPMEFRITADAFSPDRKHLANPNQKTKYAEGRTRRTPLMVAIQEGSLDDVKQLIAAGGNPDDFIPESGEGPLSYAMRRACNEKDTIIMDYLLGLKLRRETVNRPASTKRETPLKIAVEMANASAVSRLIELGADPEAACDSLPSALCYAMVLFHGSLYRDDPTQERAYFAGKTRADVYDAKEGAVLDVDLAGRRRRFLDLANASSRNRLIKDAVFDYFIRSPEEHRQVIQSLLMRGADPNRRYRVEAHLLDEWTPTLFAAQVGDLDVFRLLVEHPGAKRGDPELTLVPTSTLERFDALWIAIGYGRHAIVSYLIEREKGRAGKTLAS
ncbi:MAG TPA: ankyrin repeat domain-containing protein [Nitrospira sp.]|nr:ankyrin repeat domain-containing protein [Nitrospira sp.]